MIGMNVKEFKVKSGGLVVLDNDTPCGDLCITVTQKGSHVTDDYVSTSCVQLGNYQALELAMAILSRVEVTR